MGPRFVFNSIFVWATGGIYALYETANQPLWSLLWEEIAYAALAILWLAGAYKRPVIILGMLVSAVLIVWGNASIEPRHKIILFLPVAFLTGNLMYLYRDSLTKVVPFSRW